MRFWVIAPKGGQGVTRGKFLKNLNAIWCIMLHLLHKNLNFFLFIGGGGVGPLAAPLLMRLFSFYKLSIS